MKPNRIHGILAALTLSAAVASPLAHAADYRDALRRGDLGTPSAATATGKTVRIDLSTKYLNAAHEEVLKIDNEKGQSFV